MNAVSLLIGIGYGVFFGLILAIFFVLKLHPWRWAWLLSKVKRKPHMVAVFISRGIPGTPTVAEVGKPIKVGERLFLFSPLSIVEITPDGKVIDSQDVTEYVFKVNGIPTIFYDLDEMRPLRLEGYTDKISPDEVGALIERYVNVRMAEGMATIKRIDLRMLLLLIGVGITLLATIWGLVTLFNVQGQIHQINLTLQNLAKPGIAPGTPTGVVEGNVAGVVK